jgi:hypothetical protein
MSSVLYQSGLNYQATNPVRNEIQSLHRQVDELKWRVDTVMGAFDKLGGDAQEFIKNALIEREQERASKAAAAAAAVASRNAPLQQSSQSATNFGSSIASIQAQLNQPPGAGRRF